MTDVGLNLAMNQRLQIGNALSSGRSYWAVSPSVAFVINSDQWEQVAKTFTQVDLSSEIIFIPLSDSGNLQKRSGGSHWSLLVFHRGSAGQLTFYHFDSLHDLRHHHRYKTDAHRYA